MWTSWETSGCATYALWCGGMLRWSRWAQGLLPHSPQLKDPGGPVWGTAGAAAWCRACLFRTIQTVCFQWLLYVQAVQLKIGPVWPSLWLTYNQQVGCWTVHPRFVRANAGNVSCVCKVYSRDGQYALYVQAIYSTGANPFLYCYLLRTLKKKK